MLVLLSISCSKDDNSNENINVDAGIISHSQVAAINMPSANLSQNIYDGSINGTPIRLVKSGDTTLTFYMPNDIPVGNYDLLIPSLNATIGVEVNETSLVDSADDTMTDFFTNLTTYSQTLDTSTPEDLDMSQSITVFSNFYNNSNQEQKDAFAVIYKANKAQFDNFFLNIDAGRNPNSFFSDLFLTNSKATFEIALGVGLVVAAPVLAGATAVAAGVLGVLLAKKGCERAYRANQELIENVYDDVSIKVAGFFGVNNRINENVVLTDNLEKQLTFEVSRRKIIASDESKTTPLATMYFDSYERYNELTGEINQTIGDLNNENTVNYGDVSLETLPTSSPEIVVTGTAEMFSNFDFSINNANLSLQQATLLSDGQLKLKASITGNPTSNSITSTLIYSYDNEFSKFSGTLSLRVDRSLVGTWQLESFENGIPIGQYKDLFSTSCPSIVIEKYTFLSDIITFNSSTYTDNATNRYIYLNKTISSNCVVQNDAADTTEDVNEVTNGTYTIEGINVSIINSLGEQLVEPLIFVNSTKIKIGNVVLNKQ